MRCSNDIHGSRNIALKASAMDFASSLRELRRLCRTKLPLPIEKGLCTPVKKALRYRFASVIKLADCSRDL